MFYFGDSEIREISFAHPNMAIRLFDQVNGTTRALLCREVKFCLFETDHPQNVVGEVYIFDDLDTAMRHPEFRTFAKFRNADALLGEKFAGCRIVYIQPITSGECIVACGSVRIRD